MISKEETKKLMIESLSQSKADETEILLTRGKSELSRFSNSVIHQSTSKVDDYIQVRAVLGKKIGIASTNQVSELSSTIEKAYEAAKLSKEKADFVSLPSEGSIEAQGTRYSQETADFGPKERADYIGNIIEAAKDYKAAGMFETSAAFMAIANSKGIFSFQRQTEANLNTIIFNEDASAYSYTISYDAGKINPEALGKEAYGTVIKSKNPITIEPGVYTVVLKAAAVAEMLGLLSVAGFGALSYQEKRSFMNGKMGKQIASKKINLFDNASDKMSFGWLFDYEGVKREKVDLLINGVAKNVVFDSFTANRGKTKNTGHALPAGSTYGPLPLNLILDNGKEDVDELISGVDKGLLINRFHYTNLEDPVKTVFTGMTRDGTFLIEKGKVTTPVTNMRFTQNILKALLEVEGFSKERSLASGLGGYSYVPAAKIGKFNFSSSYNE